MELSHSKDYNGRGGAVGENLLEETVSKVIKVMKPSD
jgi:hypothetical protein